MTKSSERVFSEKRAYNLHALDLTEKKGRVETFSSLRVHEFSQLKTPRVGSEQILSHTQTAQLVDDYAARISQVSRPALYVPPQDYKGKKITTSTCNPFTCEEIKEKILEDVRDYASTMGYNSFPIITSFLKHFENECKQDPTITEAQAFATFNPDSRNKDLFLYGSTCASQSIEITQRIKEKFGIQGHPIVETEGTFFPPFHAAAAIPCTDGIILLEPSFPDPLIIIKPDQTNGESEIPIGDNGAKVNFAILTAPGNYRSNKLMISKMEKNKEGIVTRVTQFLLRPVANPDHTVMKNYMLRELIYPVSQLSKTGENISILVDVQKEMITFKKGMGRNADRKSIPFAAFDTSDPSLGEYFNAMNIPKQELEENLFLIIKHSNTLKNLHRQVGKA